MSLKREQKLFDAITLIRDDLVEDAQEMRRKSTRPTWKALAAAACAVLAIGVGGVLVWSNLGGSSGSGNAGNAGGGTFMSYAGPVLPLTLTEDVQGITAERTVTYDFSLPSEDSVRVWGSDVEDSYTLTNHTAEEQTVAALYPFVSSFHDLDTLTPAVTVDGAAVQPILLTGGSSGSSALHSWEDYKSLMADGDYQADALSPAPSLDQAVTVYEFSDFDAPWEELAAVHQAISFHIDQAKTVVLTYGFEGGAWDGESNLRLSYSVPDSSTGRSERKLLIVLGEDIGTYILQGYQNGACEPGEELDGVSATVTRYEAALPGLMDDLVADFFSQYGNGMGLPAGVSTEMFSGVLYQFLTQRGILDNQRGALQEGLESFFNEVFTNQRVLYLEFPVTTPPRGSAAVTASLRKSPSYDYVGSGSKKASVQGYDLAARLGSVLMFDSLTARLTNTDRIKIVEQNFGFNLPDGVSEVTLDPSVERYYLEIRPLES